MWDLWEKYLRFKPDIKFRYVNYYDVMDGDSTLFKTFPNKSLKEIAKLFANDMELNISWFKGPAEIRKEINLQPENLRLVMQVKYKGRSTFLRTFSDLMFWPDETNVSAAFKRLQQIAFPKVLFTSGNLERNIYKTGEREYQRLATAPTIRNSLVNLGFDVDTINLDQEDIPADVSILTVADPKTALSEEKQKKIKQFIADGGDVFFIGEPGKQQLLNPLLADVGAKLSPGMLMEITKDEMPHMVRPQVTKEAFDLSDQFVGLRQKLAAGEKLKPIRIQMQGVAEVDDEESGTTFTKFSVLTTRKAPDVIDLFNKMGSVVVDSVAPVFNSQEGDEKKETFSTLTAYSRRVNNKEQRVMVAGDADFMSTASAGGGVIANSLFSWLADNRFPVYAPKKRTHRYTAYHFSNNCQH